MSPIDACKRLLPSAVRDPLPCNPAPHEAYAALLAAMCGSGVLTMAECKIWAREIVQHLHGSASEAG